MVAMPYFLRRQLGRVAAFTAAVLLAIGPSYLYFSRFAREDIYFAAISFALLVVVFRFLDEPRRWHPALIGALIAAGFATKETMYITGFVAFTFFVLLFLREGRGGETWATVRSVGWEAWVWALAAFAAVFTLLFTVFLTNPSGLWDGLYESIHYWLGQHDVGRGGEKPYFYVVVLFAHEWPVLVLAARRGGAGVPPADRVPRVPRVGVRAVAGDLLVGGREVRLARAAPAAAADPARGHRRPVDVGEPRHDAGARRAGGRGGDRALRPVGVVAGERRAPRGPARVPRLDPVLGGGQAGRRQGGAMARKKPEALGHRRLRRRRDVPLRVVLPRPQRRLPRPQHGRRAAALRRAGGDRAQPGAAGARPRAATTAGASRSASGGCASTASSRSATGLRWFTGARRGTRRAGSRSGSTRAAPADHRSSHTIVPSRSYTRRPSSSHFASPASP